MPYRKVVFADGEFYHIINRGVAQQPIFLSIRDYSRFLSVIDFYKHLSPPLSYSHYIRLPEKQKSKFIKNLKKKPQLVEIICYCLMPNHFHLLLKQLRNKGTPTMIGNIQNSYARYFNTKYERAGPLFQSMFKAVRIETDEQLLHVSRYIHLNPSTSYVVETGNLDSYPWSSLPEYLSLRESTFINTKIVLDYFKSKKEYKEFVLNQADYQRKLARIKHLILE